jgi:hypothetical protein
MTNKPKRGRPASLVAAQRVSLTLPADVVLYLRKHWPSASEGVRALVAGHKSTPSKTTSL